MESSIDPLERWEIQKEAATIRGQASVYCFSHLCDPLYRGRLIRDLSYWIDEVLHQFSVQHYSKSQALSLFRQERQNLIQQNQQLTIYGVDVITDAMVMLNHHSGYDSAQRLILVALALANEDPLKELETIQPIWESENGQRFKLFRYVAQEQLNLRNNGLGNSKMSLEEREKLALELLNQRIIATSDPVMTPVYEEVKPKLTLKQRLDRQRQQIYDALYDKNYKSFDNVAKKTKPQIEISIKELWFDDGNMIPLRKSFTETTETIWKKAETSNVCAGLSGDGIEYLYQIKVKFDITNKSDEQEKAAIYTKVYDEDGTKSSAAILSNTRHVQAEKGKVTEVEQTFKVKFMFDGFFRKNIRFEFFTEEGLPISEQPKVMVYSFPQPPNLPWVITEKDNDQNPWTDALDMLLDWELSGKKDVVDISTEVTRFVNENAYLKYDLEEGGSFYCKVMGTFQCSDFIKNYLNKAEIEVNCTDCATIVSTFANLLGADLSQVKFGYNFQCHKIISIGYNYWDYPFSQYYGGVAGAFSYHEIAIESNNTTFLGNIYDACLKIDDNIYIDLNDNIVVDSNNKKALLPTDIRFAAKRNYTYIGSALYYKEKLVLSEFGDVKHFLNSKIDNHSIVKRKIK